MCKILSVEHVSKMSLEDRCDSSWIKPCLTRFDFFSHILWAVSLLVPGLTAMEASVILYYASIRLQSRSSRFEFCNFLAIPFTKLLGGPFVLLLSITDHQNGLPF